MDTTNIPVCCGGAFDGLEKVIPATVRARRHRLRRAGKDDVAVGRTARRPKPEDLIKFGSDSRNLLAACQSLPAGRKTGRSGVGHHPDQPKMPWSSNCQKLFGLEGAELEIATMHC